MDNYHGKKIQNFDPEQKYKKIRSTCRRTNVLFEDEKFQASNALLPGSRWNYNEIKWLRPPEICEKLEGLEPRMVVGERDRFDINQGGLGDCWFLAPLASLAENQHYFEKVVPSGQNFEENYNGVFRFRFYRFGEWHEVVIDDKLPTRNGQLIYLSAKMENEFWSPLLEKAYAKFYGSYAAIEKGISTDAAVDFTGGIPQFFNIKEALVHMGSEQLFHLLKMSYRNDAIITCAVETTHRYEAKTKGLISDHAYSITKVQNIKDPKSNKSIPLVRLRNPHGNEKEWNGDWSDGSEQWNAISKKVKTKLGLEFESDGEFYMEYNPDFLRYFGMVEVVKLNPFRMELNEGKNTRNFNLFEIYGQWRKGDTAGGTNNFEKNPQHNFTIVNKRDKAAECSVVITLMQKCKRKKEHSIGFRLYRRNEEQSEETFSPSFLNNALNVMDTSGKYVNLREVCKTFNLPEGSYCFVPSTYESGQEAEYLVRICVDVRWNCETEGKKFSIRDHNCCFTFGFSFKNMFSSSCFKPACKCICSSDNSKTESNQEDEYYKNTSAGQSDEGRAVNIKIQSTENSGNKERKREKHIEKIFIMNDSSASETKLLRQI